MVNPEQVFQWFCSQCGRKNVVVEPAEEEVRPGTGQREVKLVGYVSAQMAEALAAGTMSAPVKIYGKPQEAEGWARVFVELG